MSTLFITTHLVLHTFRKRNLLFTSDEWLVSHAIIITAICFKHGFIKQVKFLNCYNYITINLDQLWITSSSENYTKGHNRRTICDSIEKNCFVIVYKQLIMHYNQNGYFSQKQNPLFHSKFWPYLYQESKLVFIYRCS